MPVMDSVVQLTSLLERWEQQNQDGGASADVLDTFTRIAELIEKETEAWYRVDPDPFDDRHPGRTDPNCSLGHLLKALFKNDHFMNRLVSSYILGNRDQPELQTLACRILLDAMPGLEASAVFQDNETLVQKLVQWAQTASEPLRSYAVGLLAGAMEVQDIAANFKESNAVLVPMLLQRLESLKNESMKLHQQKKANRAALGSTSVENLARPFANIGENDSLPARKVESDLLAVDGEPDAGKVFGETSKVVAPPESLSGVKGETSLASGGDQADAATPREVSSLAKSDVKSCILMRCLGQKAGGMENAEAPVTECSNSSWAEMEPYVIGCYRMHPLSPDMQQRLILQYLTPMGEYQELLGHVFEHHAMNLIFYYLDLSQNTDVRLAFEATKYLAALLCHKKFAMEFIQEGGVQKLLNVYRPSVAATGVSMCLYYLAYFEDAMERVCLLPYQVLSRLVSYVLWLLECSHESGRCHATMFFSMAFQFRIILQLFDVQDGLRKLYNVISTLQILRTEEDGTTILGDDQVFTSRQAGRHVCVALKRYFEAHLAIKADQIRRSHVRHERESPLPDIPGYKASKFPPEVVQDNIELLLECFPLRMQWEPVSHFIKLGGISLLLQLVAMAVEWNAYTGKAETIRSALDVLSVCAVMPKTQLLLCEAVPLPENTATPCISILLGLAEGDILTDPDVQRSALNTIINCVCAPVVRLSGGVGRVLGGSVKRKMNQKNGEELLFKMWECVRANNGIMVLLKLLMIQTPITEADAIRALACKALLGLARCDTVKQIISKLPLFNNGQLQYLMREPVLQDKREEHSQFCRYASDLIERVSGKSPMSHIDISLDRIRKADVVAQTKIIYHEKELLQLIHEHLVNIGMTQSATALQVEADLPRCSTPPPPHPSSPHIFSTPTSAPRLTRHLSTPGSMPLASRSADSLSQQVNKTCSALSLTAGPPIKISIISSKTQSPTHANQTRMMQTKRIIRQKHEATSGSLQSPLVKRSNIAQRENSVTLDKIVSEYLREQHSYCSKPVVTCPPFSLLSRHRCPEPKHRTSAPPNITARVARRSIFPSYGGPDGMKLDRKYIYSRFRPIRSYRDSDDGSFSCCSFSACEQYLMLGTYQGELKMYNLQTAEDGKLVLTSSSWGTPLSSLWKLGDLFEMQQSFEEDHYLEFSNQQQDRIVGTKEETAHIYDVATGRRIMKLYDQDKANNYTRNRATFNPSDDLILNDGVLWDVNSGKAIHKFDKFNANVSGVFHPMGLEIIINSEVWDLRSFHLLHTVPALDQCQLRFNHGADVIYGAIHQSDESDELAEDRIKSPFGSSFRTFDGTDYSNITTIDVKKDIFDLCTDSSDCYLAVIENASGTDSLGEDSLCRLYEVGRRKDVEDDQMEEEEEEEGEGMDDDDDDDDDSDNDDEDDDDDDDNSDGDANENQEGNNGSDDEDGEDALDSHSDLSVATMDSDEDDEMDDVYFELSDLSNF